MSVGISLADLLKIVNGCIWLQQRFEKNNSADERLGQFLNDINILQRRLGRLKDALNDALEQYEDPDIDIDARNFRCDLHSLIGDIEQTILEATELANRHIDIKRNAAGFIHNVIWAAHAEPKVDVLRKAMQFHAQKIFLVMEPVKDRQLRTIDGKMDEMLEKIDILLGNPQYVLAPLPDWLDARFMEEIFKSQPTPFNQLSEIPLSTGFDALYLHYRGSTAFWDQETAEQTVEQYLNLLKCQWLLDVLRKSLQQRRTSSLYPRVLKQMETKLIKEHQRRDITRFDDAELRNASATAFQIWIVEQEVADIGGPPEYSNSPEHVILRLRPPNALAGEEDGVVIFRTGPTTLRIARRAPERHGVNCYESEHYNIHQDVFIPFYAIADTPAPRRHSTATIPSQTVSMSINRGNGTGSINYALSGDANILAFQRAITGYQVVFDKKVKWAIKKSGAFRMPSWEEGRMQIWHWKPLEEQASASNTPLANQPLSSPTDSVFSEGSRASSTSDAVVEKLLGGRDTSIYSLDERSLAGSVISATTPPHPVVIIYGKRNEVYTYYHLELDFGLGINPSTCDCETESKKAAHDQKCDRSVIERRGEERSFTIRTMTADRGNLNTWNLGIFAQPRHPLFKSERICHHISTKFLSFKFMTVADRIEFVAKFDNALRLRNKAEKEFQRIVKDTEYLGEKNGRLAMPISPRSPSRTDSMYSIQRVSEQPPVLPPLSPRSTFSARFPRTKF